MSQERQFVEEFLRELHDEAKGITDDLRLRDLMVFAMYLGAAIVYGLSEIDDDLWHLIETINKEVADNAVILGETPDDLSGIDLPEVPQMTGQQVRDRISDQLRAAEELLGSENLTSADRLLAGMAYKLVRSLVLQLRELDDDTVHLTSAVMAGSARLATLLSERGR